MLLFLASQASMATLGNCLATALITMNPGALLLYGPLGCGKTTLTRSLVEALPDGEKAEVSSPSFTICNIYYTDPVVHHFDLYRLGPDSHDSALEESLDDTGVLTIVEWAEHMAARSLPSDGIMLRLKFDPLSQARSAEIVALGTKGALFLHNFLTFYPV